MELGVHDLIYKDPSEGSEAAYERTKAFVQDIEALNYKRYWFAEHHNTENFVSVSPELLVAYMAALTSKMRLGTGGTMIMHYSPLKIAENFKTLTALAPGRIDIGLGRAPGSGPNEIIALAEGKPSGFDDMYDKIEVILDYLLDQQPEGIYGRTRAMPHKLETRTEPWMLGSSGQSALKTAELGLGYSFAKFFGIETSPEVFQLYRENFKPSEFFDKPRVMVSYQIIVAESEEEVDYIAKPIELAQIAQARGIVAGPRDPEEVKDYQLSARELNFLENYYDKRFLIKGTPGQVADILEEEIELYGIDEILIYAPILDPEARLASYRHLARMFNKI